MAKETAPHSIEAEKALLGALLINPDRIDDVLDVMSTRDLWRRGHQSLFDAIVAVKRQGSAVDLVTVSAQLAQVGTLEDVGGPSYVASLCDGVPRSSNAMHYATIVADHARRREALTLMDQADRALRETDSEIAATIDDMVDSMKKMAVSRQSPWLSAESVLATVTAQLSERYELKAQGITGISTGFMDLDEISDGLHGGRLITTGADTGIGKTAVALNIAAHVAQQATVGFVSLEMSGVELVQRLLASKANIDLRRVIRGYIRDAEFSRLTQAMGDIGQLKLYIDCEGTRTVSQVRTFAKHLKVTAGLSLLVVDYLQLMTPVGKKNETRATEVGAMARGLKILARDLDVPVIAISQLSRPQQGQQGKKPTLSRLRESGEVEQHSDQVWLLWRPDPQNPMGQDPRVAELNIAKNRQGPSALIQLNWIQEQTRFANLSERAV